MARQVNRLSARFVATATKPGYYADGGNLYLQISESGSKSWIFRFRRAGRLHDMGLGALRDTPLKEAREKALQYRKQVQDGRDPLDERRRARARLAADESRFVTFRDAAQEYMAAHRAGWKNVKHAAQWASTLEQYAYPTLAELAVSDIEPDHVLRVLDPIWREKTETASRVRQRIEAILDYAKARKWCEGENPAKWRGGLAKLLPAPATLRRVKHHAAMDYREIGTFMVDLRQREAMAARCLEFTILTAVRTGEAIGARWEEFDLDGKVWTIPAERMKGRKNAERDHAVPLSSRAAEIVRNLREAAFSDYVFTGNRDRPLSNMAMLTLLRRMGVSDGVTVHGFRSTFRDWVGEATSFPPEVAEMALAHTVGNKVEQAYRRGDLFEKRRLMMDAWAAYCARARAPADVVSLTRGA